MRSFLFTLAAISFLLTPSQSADAQSAEMPLPIAVVKDADGKLIAQIVDIGPNEGSDPKVLLNIGGTPVPFRVSPLKGVFESQRFAYFPFENCSGSPAITPPLAIGWDSFSQTSFAVVGPDPDSGTYKVYRSTSPTPVAFSPLSYWIDGSCDGITGQTLLSPAEEVVPNPLAGFHGPTTANPERVWTIEGGTRLP